MTAALTLAAETRPLSSPLATGAGSVTGGRSRLGGGGTAAGPSGGGRVVAEEVVVPGLDQVQPVRRGAHSDEAEDDEDREQPADPAPLVVTSPTSRHVLLVPDSPTARVRPLCGRLWRQRPAACGIG